MESKECQPSEISTVVLVLFFLPLGVHDTSVGENMVYLKGIMYTVATGHAIHSNFVLSSS